MVKKVILVVDNDEEVQEVMVDAFLHVGFYSLSARSGRQALSFLEDVIPSVVILDFLLADMDGVELARAIRARAFGPLIPMLMVTGAEDAARKRLLKENLNIQVLVKPVNVALLTSTIENLSAGGVPSGREMPLWHPPPSVRNGNRDQAARFVLLGNDRDSHVVTCSTPSCPEIGSSPDQAALRW